MPVTFYPSVVILRGGGWTGIEIEYPLGYAGSGDSLFRDTGNRKYSIPLNHLTLPYIPKAVDQGHVTLLALFDFSAACDTVDHTILLKCCSTSVGPVDSAFSLRNDAHPSKFFFRFFPCDIHYSYFIINYLNIMPRLSISTRFRTIG